MVTALLLGKALVPRTLARPEGVDDGVDEAAVELGVHPPEVHGQRGALAVEGQGDEQRGTAETKEEGKEITSRAYSIVVILINVNTDPL